MDVLIVLVFVSLVLVAGSIVLFLFTVRQRDFEHGDRLSLLPLLDSPLATDASRVSTAATDPSRVVPTRADSSLADVQDPSESTRS